jgi:hypothetical protein
MVKVNLHFYNLCMAATYVNAKMGSWFSYPSSPIKCAKIWACMWIYNKGYFKAKAIDLAKELPPVTH